MENCSVVVPEGAHVYLTVPGGSAEGNVSELPVKDGTVQLTVSETPVFLSISTKEKPIVNNKGKQIRPAAISLKADFSSDVCEMERAPENSTLNQFYRMFDEPETMPEYRYSDTAALNMPETNVRVSNQTCYVKLDQPYVLDGFGIYDTYGTGSFEVYDAKTDRLLWRSDLDSYMARCISIQRDSAPTDLLKIVKGGGDLNEFALYGYPADPAETDINGDRVFDSGDAAALIRWLLTADQTLANPAAADLNADSVIDCRDLNLLKRKLLQ